MPKELAVRTTAYTHTESDHIEYGKKTAAGTKLQYGKKYSSAAADWSKFPLGTRFKIDGMDTTFVIDDYGSALVGTETIDIYQPSRSAMNRWGVRHVDIRILNYGDFEKSRDILADRTRYSHVRKMLASIDKHPGPKPQKGFPADTPPVTAPPAGPAAPERTSEPALQLAANDTPKPETAAPRSDVAETPAPAAPTPEAVIAPERDPYESVPSFPTAPRKVRPLTVEVAAALVSTPAEPVVAVERPANAPRERAFRPLPTNFDL
ncbi:MAG: 3D domain-containing protein [Verrucomicrobiae bacterium]|nr:3D domain-containing protein [Verrucomicrobiae bacterium]